MAFDDLARHMAARDRRSLRPIGTANELVIEAQRDSRRMARMRDLILGPLMLVIGLFISALVYSSLVDFFTEPTPAHPTSTDRYPLMLVLLALGLVIGGLVQTVRGIRGPRTT